MSILAAVRTRLLLVLLSFLAPLVSADSELQTLHGALNTVDHYLQAGIENDAQRAAPLLAAFDLNAQRAEYDTRRLFRKQRDLLSSYVSVANGLYGYEIDKNVFGTSVELEGAIETSSGESAEFKARVVFRGKRWRIANLEID